MKVKLTQRSMVLAIAAPLSVWLGCGGSAPEDASPPAASEPAPASQPATDPTPAAPAAPAVASDALGVEEHEVGGVEVELREVQRAQGDTLNVRWRYTNTTREDKVLATGLGWYTPYKLAGDTFLVDRVNQKKYLVITDVERAPVASRYGGDYEVVLDAGQTLNSWAKFPAPPPDVETISVYIPGVMPFEEISIGQ